MAEIVTQSFGDTLTQIQRIDSKGWSVATTVVRLPDGQLLVHSPTRGLEEEVAKLGTPVALLAPNFFHYMGLGAYSERWPEAKIYASEAARPRIAKKSGLDGLRDLAELSQQLPEQLELLLPPGLRNGEVLLRHQSEAGRSWVVTDAFFHVEKNPRGAMGLMCRLTRTTPGLKLGRTFTTLAVRDKREYGSWLREELDSRPPDLMIPAHGSALGESSLASRLRDEVRARLSV